MPCSILDLTHDGFMIREISGETICLYIYILACDEKNTLAGCKFRRIEMVEWNGMKLSYVANNQTESINEAEEVNDTFGNLQNFEDFVSSNEHRTIKLKIPQ